MGALLPVTRRSPRTVTPLVLGGAALALAVGCARQGSIPGGPPDRVPPIVVTTEPEGFARIPGGFDGPVRIRFNERISERSVGGTLLGAVVVSPTTGELRVRHQRDGIDVSQDGGFPPGRVFRVTVLPRVQDMFQNTLREPFELVFSTGPEFTPGVVAGVVVDRITGAPAATRVEVVADGDSVPTWTMAGDDGVFALRYLTPGDYTLAAYEDRNANGETDFSESQGRLPVSVAAAGDTSIVEVEVLLPDTTPARLTGVEVVDSLTLLATFDDYMDPDVRQDVASGTLRREDGQAPEVERVLLPQDWVAIYQPVMPEDEAVIAPGGDSAAVEARPGVTPLADARADARAGPAEIPEPEPTEPRPDQRLYLRLTTPLEPEVLYSVLVEGVVNINGVTGGGGEGEVLREPEPEPPPPADSAAVPDSGAVQDTAAMRDTAVVNDTVRFRP